MIALIALVLSVCLSLWMVFVLCDFPWDNSKFEWFVIVPTAIFAFTVTSYQPIAALIERLARTLHQ